MKNTFDFLVKAGSLKNIKRRGVAFYGVKNPDSTVDHSFRMALMVWLLNNDKKNINTEKAVKMALIHDICKVHAGDITPYDCESLAGGKEAKKCRKIAMRWRRLSKKEKEKWFYSKYKKEHNALEKLTAELPEKFRKEIKSLWTDYMEMKSPESRFVHQINVLENLMEALECRRLDKNFPTLPWWEHANEVVDHPLLLMFGDELKKEELRVK